MSLGTNYRKLFAASTVSNLGDGVGVIAYPWLASAITRSPLLIALVAVAQRLPWLLFTLPAGVITDRHDRRRLMVGANGLRFVLTTVVALAVFARQDVLPTPDAVDQVVGTDAPLYVVLLLATLLLGVGEVLYDNSAQTFLPAIVADRHLERANGRMFASETVANLLLGPPLAGVLLAVGFALPFVVDAATFAASAGLVAAIVVTRRPPPDETARKPWRTEAADGFRWLWRHPVLRTMALSLGALNLLNNATFAVFVIYAQEVLDTSTGEFAALSAAPAAGGVIGGWVASGISRRLGPGRSLAVTVGASGVLTVVVGVVSSWPVVAVLLAATWFFAVLWNVITVSFRQSVIPDHLLGRVNSVYRFFGWGAIPVGALLGGVLVAVLDGPVARDTALRVPWIVTGLAHFALLGFVARGLATSKLEAVRASARDGNVRATEPADR
jgi:MFS family permease